MPISDSERLSNVLKTLTIKSKRNNIPRDIEKTLRGNSDNRSVVFKMDERKKMKEQFYASIKEKTENRLS